MSEAGTGEARARRANAFTAGDVAAILRERGWLAESAGHKSHTMEEWLADAAALLGPHCATREELAELLALVFHYDARALLQQPASHAVLAREGGRAVVRELALQVLDGSEISSDRFKAIVTTLKEKLPQRGRELFFPIRLALAGRAGEGSLDRIVLLLDRAAAVPFAVKVKSCRERILEFCSTMQ